MKRTSIVGFIIFLAVVLSACGHGGGGGGGGAADPNAPAAVTLTPSKSVALANTSDVVTMQADVRKADGAAVPDGTAVTFTSSSAACSLSTPSAVTTNGLASVTLIHPAVPGANNQTVTVTGTAGGASDSEPVKFINEPSSVDVFIAFDQPVTNLAALQFKLNNAAGASFSNTDPQLISAINTAAGSLVIGNFSASNSNTIFLINAAGFNTGMPPIIKATYALAPGAGLVAFSVDATPASFSATDINGNATTPDVTSANMVVTTVFNTE